MNTISWFHLSDLHIKDTPTHRYEANRVLKALVEDAARIVSREKVHPDRSTNRFLFVTGDVAYHSWPMEYTLASSFLDDLRENTGIYRADTFIVPGNHDINQKEVTGPATAVAKDLDNCEKVSRFLLGKSEDIRLVLRRLDNYAEFVNGYFRGHLSFDDRHYYYTKQYEIGGKRLAILGLNSSWLSHGDDPQNSLLVSKVQVLEALEQTIDADIRIALVHHPFYFLKRFDRDDVEHYMKASCDFILRGHSHHEQVEFQHTLDGRTLLVTCGASYHGPRYPNSYNFVRYDANSGKGEFDLRLYNPHLYEFVEGHRGSFNMSIEFFTGLIKFDKLRGASQIA